MMTQPLAGKSALVTGGSRGIGAATADISPKGAFQCFVTRRRNL